MNVFKVNTYFFKYIEIVRRARRRRVISEYTERHHILPKSLGGRDDPRNIVRLIPREHLLAHFYLWKCVRKPHDIKMLWALNMMFVDSPLQKRTYKEVEEYSKIYDEARRSLSFMMKDRMTGNSNPMFGSTHSPEARAKISRARTGKSSSNKGKKFFQSPTDSNRFGYFYVGDQPDGWINIGKNTGKPKSEEHKAKLKKPKSDEAKANMRRPHKKPSTEQRRRKQKIMQDFYSNYSWTCEECGGTWKHPRMIKHHSCKVRGHMKLVA